MKLLVCYLTFFGYVLTLAQCPLEQTNLRASGNHFKDLNTVQLEDGSGDIIVSSNKFNSNFTNTKLQLTRINANTQNVVWEHIYDNFPNTRGFDSTRFSENGMEFIAVTGYVGDGVTFNKTFILIVNASTGTVVTNAFYTLHPNSNSQGLHIIYTERDIAGVATPGFVVAGFINDEYTTNLPGLNKGFIMRTDSNLIELWTSSTNSTTAANNDYDMLNHVTETNDGYFVTGASNQPNGSQQSIAMMKFDDAGTLLWEQNYTEGNSTDVAADALYDLTTNTVFVLVYYSFSHYFGITAIDNTTGNIDLSRSWAASGNDLNWTGFSLQASNDFNTPEDLIIFGYRREAVVDDPNGVANTASTVPFAVSFNKFTGAISRSNWFPVPYIDPPASQDMFSYWNGQSPLIYHPDIGIALDGSDCYFMLGYRSYGQNTSAMELMRIDLGLASLCLTTPFSITQFNITPSYTNAMAQAESVTQNFINLAAIPSANISGTCEDGEILATATFENKEIKLFPNPASEILNVTNLTTNSASFSILDIQGKVLKSGSLNNGFLSVSELAQGVYFIKISEENKHTIKKFIKQ
jgi:Secretion system C-terminal sorting domain